MDPIAAPAQIPIGPRPRNGVFAPKKHPQPKTRLPHAVPSLLLLLYLVQPLYSKTKNADPQSNFSTEVSASESEVLQAVSSVVNDGMIQGSKEYNRDQYVEKAAAEPSSSLFPPWTEPGKVFYKVRTKVLAPVNFKGSNDEGTLAVRYVVQSKGPQQTIVRIDAIFVEDNRRVAHRSNGTVETAEYKDIQQRLDKMELEKKETAEAEQHRQEVLAQRSLEPKKEPEQVSAPPETARTSAEALEQHVQNLRRELECLVKASGAQLKSAPFSGATNLKSLNGGTEVVILIVTPYWYGVETEDGQHGWIIRSELEPVP